MKCRECRFWLKTHSIDGECHRRAPLTNEKEHDHSTMRSVIWPMTSEDDWCGEFEAKPVVVSYEKFFSVE